MMYLPGEHGSKYHMENNCTHCFYRYKLPRRILNRIKREFAGNNWLKVLFDKGFRYFFTIGVMWYVSGQLQIINDSLIIVAFAMPVIDIVAFDLIDKYRKRK